VNATNHLAKKYGDKFHYLIVYTVDAHPKAPDTCPYRGAVWEHPFSNYSQPLNYSSRVNVVNHINDIIALDPAYTVAVDNLTPHNASEHPGGNDPVWCTWGPAPNAGWLINTNGTVVVSQPWFQPHEMDKAMGEMVGLVQNDDELIQEDPSTTLRRLEWNQLMHD